MAGPFASVLLPAPLTAADQLRIVDDIAGLAGRVEAHDFWLEDRPFIVTFDEGREELEESCLDGLPSVLGWKPRGALSFGAMCNRDRDHELLADLCIHFAERLGGLIDFGGQLPLGPDLGGPFPAMPVRVDNPGGLPGVLYATSYQTCQGHYATCHYGDVAFLRAFRHLSGFRMVK